MGNSKGIMGTIRLPVQVWGENPYEELILLQEYPDLERGDMYMRVFVTREQAEELALKILAWANGSESKQD
jgi:hypothetical protein